MKFGIPGISQLLSNLTSEAANAYKQLATVQVQFEALKEQTNKTINDFKKLVETQENDIKRLSDKYELETKRLSDKFEQETKRLSDKYSEDIKSIEKEQRRSETALTDRIVKLEADFAAVVKQAIHSAVKENAPQYAARFYGELETPKNDVVRISHNLGGPSDGG